MSGGWFRLIQWVLFLSSVHPGDICYLCKGYACGGTQRGVPGEGNPPIVVIARPGDIVCRVIRVEQDKRHISILSGVVHHNMTKTTLDDSATALIYVYAITDLTESQILNEFISGHFIARTRIGMGILSRTTLGLKYKDTRRG